MRFRRPLQGLLLCLLALVATLAPPSRGAGADDNVYTVSGVFVDATAETATAARAAAISQAQTEALQALFRRLVMEQDLTQLPVLAPDQMAGFVRDFSVSDERTAAGRYLASFTVRFNPAQVRGLLQQLGVRFAETQSKPLVVLPLWGGGADAQLWEETNPWLRAWSSRRFDEGLVPLTVPLGDLGDVATVSAQQVLAGEPQPLANLADRYHAGGAVVAQAVLIGSLEEGTAVLAVTTSRLLDGSLSKTGVLNIQQEPGEDLPRLLDRAALAVSEAVAEPWKEANLLNFASRQTIPVTVSITSLDTWLQIRRRLDSISTVIAVDLQYLRRDEARMKLTFVGSEEQLVGALAQHDLELLRGSAVGLGLEQMPQPSGMGMQPPGAAPSGMAPSGMGPPGMGMESGGAVLTPVEPMRQLRLMQPAAGAARQAAPPALGAEGAAAPAAEAPLEPTVEIQ